MQALEPEAGFDGFAQDYAAIPGEAELQGPGSFGGSEAQPRLHPPPWPRSRDYRLMSLDPYQCSHDLHPCALWASRPPGGVRWD